MSALSLERIGISAKRAAIVAEFSHRLHLPRS
jgi:hypothetical protein